ncbi:DUF1330 domain-containing protein [Streptomyces sp. NPDC051016]|uniref:DUF1330 domain-containing protein n=1 Tax=Streptomyces sp. NPDC051016 TaxID=3365638 RepID=UPI0037956521
MPKGYVIFTEAIDDPAAMAAYGRAAGLSLAESGAAVLAVDSAPQVLEGEWHGDQTVVLEFESVAAARAWYESAAYEKAKPLRQAAARTNAVIVSGIAPPAAAGG